MPPAQLMPTQLTDLSELLRQRYIDLSLVVERELHVDGTSEIAVTTASDADWTAADVDADTAIARAERDSSALTDVADALDRVQSGRYGVCEACSKDIGYTRLLAHPAARRCLACQQAMEAKPTSAFGISRSSR
ncbi:MAG: TraR/DksA C4-type zinc finger protein [Casimicrobium sp.]|jgi:DnaK suppressor protein